MKYLIAVLFLVLSGCLADKNGEAKSQPKNISSFEGHWINSEAPSNPNGLPFCLEFVGEWVCQATNIQPAACSSAPLLNGLEIVGAAFIISEGQIKVGGLSPVSFLELGGQNAEFNNIQVEADGTNEVVVSYTGGCSLRFKRVESNAETNP